MDAGGEGFSVVKNPIPVEEQGIQELYCESRVSLNEGVELLKQVKKKFTYCCQLKYIF